MPFWRFKLSRPQATRKRGVDRLDEHQGRRTVLHRIVKAACSTGRTADWSCRILPPSRTLQNPSRWLEGFYRFSPLHGVSTLQWGLKNFEARKFAFSLQTKGRALLSYIYIKRIPLLSHLREFHSRARARGRPQREGRAPARPNFIRAHSVDKPLIELIRDRPERVSERFLKKVWTKITSSRKQYI